MLQSKQKTNLPPEAYAFFPDGDKLCVVEFDFQNPQESPQGFGDNMLDAALSLRQDLLNEQAEVQKRLNRAEDLIDTIYKTQGFNDFDIMLKRNSRHVATWPAWKQNILTNSGKSTLDTPRTPRTPVINDTPYVSDGY